MPNFKSLNLAEPLERALDKLGYTTPTPIQSQAIPDVLKGRDLMGIAQTGTGKTAAFSLPLLHHIATVDRDPPKRGARVLILAPTRELASQIAVSVRDYGEQIEYLSVLTVFGGAPIQKQIKRLVGGVDVLVATPGRLIDLIDRKACKLGDVEILVLDEADQMMDMGFIHALRKIIPLLPKDRQTLFFSATMLPPIMKLAGQFLTNPVKVSVTPANKTADKVTQEVIFANKTEKLDLLTLHLLKPEVERSLVFTRTKHGADRVVKRLNQRGIQAIAIHGNKSQNQRQRALGAFREGMVNVLVATDVAARGIDIEGITHVFNYEIPNVPEQYVHRIGRTARAHAEGKAIAFVASDERPYLKSIQKLLKMQIPVTPLPDEFNKKSAALKNLKPVEKSAESILKPDAPTRKGRGKSRKKSRNSKDRNRQDGHTGSREKPSSETSKSSRPKHKPRPEGESRAARKAKNQAEHAKKHSKRPSREASKDREARPNRPRSNDSGPYRSRTKTTTSDRPLNSGKPSSDNSRDDRPRAARSKTSGRPNDGQKGRKGTSGKSGKAGPKKKRGRAKIGGGSGGYGKPRNRSR